MINLRLQEEFMLGHARNQKVNKTMSEALAKETCKISVESNYVGRYTEFQKEGIKKAIDEAITPTELVAIMAAFYSF